MVLQELQTTPSGKHLWQRAAAVGAYISRATCELSMLQAFGGVRAEKQSMSKDQKDHSSFPVFNMKNVWVCLFLSFQRKEEVYYLENIILEKWNPRVPWNKRCNQPFPPIFLMLSAQCPTEVAII